MINFDERLELQTRIDKDAPGTVTLIIKHAESVEKQETRDEAMEDYQTCSSSLGAVDQAVWLRVHVA